MTDPAGDPPWMVSWLATQRDFAALAAAWTRPATGPPIVEAGLAPMVDQYRRLFAPPAALSDALAAGAAAVRYQQAAERYSRLLSAIAADAGRRFTRALAENGPDARPVTTLHQLHELWIECGEAAWSSVAHGEAFAAAQADLLVALAELQAAGSSR